MSKWIKKGDKVIVISGNSRGSTGEVLSRDGDFVTVGGVNIRKKHVKPRNKNEEGRIDSKEMPIHVSNVSLCNADNKPVRVKVRITDGVKELYYKNGSTEVVHRQV